MSLEWIDTHAHLDHDYPFPLEEYLRNAKAAGIRVLVTIGTTPGSLERVRDLADSHPEVFFTIGIHPHEAKDYTAQVEATMARLRSHPKCVAVGEIGLDYHYDHSPREVQRAALERQLELALEWELPAVIHAREAEEDLLERFKPFASRGGRAVIHCFSGTRHFAEECLKLGFLISFSGIVTFKKAEELQAIARDVPLDRILLETDSPYLAPTPYRGKPNQSAYLTEIARCVASLRGLELSDLSAATVANSRRIFRI